MLEWSEGGLFRTAVHAVAAVGNKADTSVSSEKEPLQNPTHGITPLEISSWIYLNCPEECALRLSMSKSAQVKSKSQFINQIRSQISSHRKSLAHRFSEIEYVEAPVRFYLRNKAKPTSEVERVYYSITLRNQRSAANQMAFRSLLMREYGICALSKTKTPETLEAAHIRDWAMGGDFSLQNGILLRRDLHALFDRGLLSICPDTMRVSVRNTCDSDYLSLDGTSITGKYSERIRESLVWRSRNYDKNS